MNRYINKIQVLSLLLLASLFSFTACSDDDDNQSGSVGMDFVGGWFLDWSSSDKVMWNEMNFSANGAFYYCTITSSLKEEIHLKEEDSSTYTKNGNVLSCLYNWASTGTSSTERLEITYLDKYTCTMVNQAYGAVETYSRIVDTYYVNVGDETPFTFDDPEFVPTSYTSTDERIVTVSEQGNMKAVKRGTTYVTARASVGAVTIKVIVSDQQNATYEYGEDLGLSKKQILAKYGKDNLKMDQLNAWLYFPGYRDINELMFFFDARGNVKRVYAQYWDVTDFAKIAQSFEKKYERIGAENNGFSTFLASNEQGEYYVSVDKTTSLVSYEKKEDDFVKYDGCISMSADQVANTLGYPLTAEDDGVFLTSMDGTTYTSAMVLYDTETLKTKMIVYTCADGVTEEDMLKRVKDYYPAYVEDIGYCARDDWWNLESRVFVTVSTNNRGHVQVKYSAF